MSYQDTARAFARAERSTRAGCAPTPEALAADRLPLSEWSESRRDLMSPQTIAANHALHVRLTAHELREALGAPRTPAPAEKAARVAAAARDLLAAIGEDAQ